MGTRALLVDKRKLIEEHLPISDISTESVREKSIRHGHISTLHLYWARRPLAVSRVTALAALLPATQEIVDKWRLELPLLAKWETVSSPQSSGQYLIKQARQAIREAYGGRAPRVLDPFCGGGSLLLEAQRLGCEVHAIDYNPLAVLIEKATLEYPQRFGPKLLEAVERWGKWVYKQALEELKSYYPPDPDGWYPAAYLWARTIPCQNPTCGAEIPLLRQTWIVRKPNRQIALRLIPNPAAKRVDFELVGQGGEALRFDPSRGTTSRGRVTCPLCGSTLTDKETRQLFREGRAGQRMLLVVLHRPGQPGKRYRLATPRDLQAYQAAEAALLKYRNDLYKEWGIDPVPDEPTPRIKVPPYGFARWGELFNARQQLSLIALAKAVRHAYEEMYEYGLKAELAKAVATYLAFAMDKVADYCNAFCRWVNSNEKVAGLFARQAIPMVWDYAESNPITGGSGSFLVALKYIQDALSHVLSTVVLPEGQGSAENQPQAKVTRASATKIPYPDAYFDAVLTDPPYYDNILYANLSDFFYVWLKRTVGHLHWDLFATPLIPKSEEMVVQFDRASEKKQSRAQYEERLKQAFREIYRVLKPEGVALVIYAHKTTEAWEAVLSALLEAGLYPTASWPISVEMKTRSVARDTAALASNIYLVCRKRVEGRVGLFSDVLRELRERLPERLRRFWQEGIRGADFFMSAIGPAIEVFGRYERVEELDGTPVSIGELLAEVRRLVTEFALREVLEQQASGRKQQTSTAGIDGRTRLYLLWWWLYRRSVLPYDEARKLATSLGVELDRLKHAPTLIQQEKSAVRLLGANEKRAQEILREWRAGRDLSYLDVLHGAVELRRRRESQSLMELLKPYAQNELFWRIAQALAEVLPESHPDRKDLQGLLYVRDSYTAPSQPQQGTLFS